MNYLMRTLFIFLCCFCIATIPSEALAIGEGGTNPDTGTNEPWCPGCRTTSDHDTNDGVCTACISGLGDSCQRGSYGPGCSS